MTTPEVPAVRPPTLRTMVCDDTTAGRISSALIRDALTQRINRAVLVCLGLMVAAQMAPLLWGGEAQWSWVTFAAPFIVLIMWWQVRRASRRLARPGARLGYAVGAQGELHCSTDSASSVLAAGVVRSIEHRGTCWVVRLHHGPAAIVIPDELLTSGDAARLRLGA